MVENLMLAETDPGNDPNLLDQAKKWGGRVVLGAIMAHYVRSSYIHIKNNPWVKRAEEAIHHHEHQETSEDR